MTEYQVIVDEKFNEGEPVLESGYTVLQVVDLLEHDYTVHQAAERLEIAAEEVEAAEEYYRNHRSELDDLWAEKRQVAEEYSFTSP